MANGKPARLAVLIDAENASARIAEALFTEIATLGEASARRVYGDFSSAQITGWTKVLARWAIVSGAAILVEPGPSLHPELFAWARPTIVSGSVAELLALADGVATLAPRFLRRRWLRQRGDRLRLLLVEGDPAVGDLDLLRERWQVFAPAHAIDVRRVLV